MLSYCFSTSGSRHHLFKTAQTRRNRGDGAQRHFSAASARRQPLRWVPTSQLVLIITIMTSLLSHITNGSCTQLVQIW